MCFSALQRAENSSTAWSCSSAGSANCFSALQRAENSSTVSAERAGRLLSGFQCSSASRKFLNERRALHQRVVREMFQCSSASRKFLNCATSGWGAALRIVSVLFSEPKIPQRARSCRVSAWRCGFSALQRAENSSTIACLTTPASSSSFSALQRAENSSTAATKRQWSASTGFQCSSASRKFLN